MSFFFVVQRGMAPLGLGLSIYAKFLVRVINTQNLYKFTHNFIIMQVILHITPPKICCKISLKSEFTDVRHWVLDRPLQMCHEVIAEYFQQLKVGLSVCTFPRTWRSNFGRLAWRSVCRSALPNEHDGRILGGWHDGRFVGWFLLEPTIIWPPDMSFFGALSLPVFITLLCLIFLLFCICLTGQNLSWFLVWLYEVLTLIFHPRNWLQNAVFENTFMSRSRGLDP